ncbi:MAG TPA: glycosyltransferase family 87 protein, partial [Gemmatimonadales bacterium]|nr:glycosyltransferase family 87 protein [Gemmatimonadales bacterium]
PWPPFATLALIPLAVLARLSMVVAKGLWAIGNVALFGWCLVQGFRGVGRWTPVVLAGAAVAQPLQSNFQHLNINIVLLGLVVLAIGELERGRDLRAALWLGVATALKGYPGAMFLYFLARGRWRPLAAGIAVALGFTVVAGLPYGPAGAFDLAGTYARLAARAGSTQALSGQPIGRTVMLLGGSLATAATLSLLTAIAVAGVLWRDRHANAPLSELGLTAVLALLVAPLDRLHFYVLAFPAWTHGFSLPAPARGRSLWLGALAVGALLTSGMLSFIRTPLPEPLRFIRQNTYPLGAFILLSLLVVRRAPPIPPVPQPAVTQPT